MNIFFSYQFFFFFFNVKAISSEMLGALKGLLATRVATESLHG